MDTDKKYGWVFAHTRGIPGERMVERYRLQQIVGLLICIVWITTLVVPCSAADTVTLSVSMFKGEQQTRFNRPVLVAGIWHYVNITTDQNYDELTVTFYKGILLTIQEKNETNYYAWTYDTTNVVDWNDVSGYEIQYIQPSLCKRNNTQYSFCIGIKDTMPNSVDYSENWTLEIAHQGTTLSSEPIVVAKPKTGVSLSKPESINFHVDPFTVMDAAGDAFFKIGNIGNVPLYVNRLTDQYDYIEITGINQEFVPQDVITQYVTVHSQHWPPGIKRITMQLNGSYPRSYFIDTNATITLYSSFIIDVPQLVIYVGHSNFRIDEIEGTAITFQYQETLTMHEGELRDINAYVSGNGDVTVSIWADEKNLSVRALHDGTTETHSPLSFTSTNTSERDLIVTVEALSEGTVGLLNYQVTANGQTKTYTTRITIGPPTTETNTTSGLSFSLVQIIVIILVLLVVVYMVISYMKKRTR
jgi:hypothetical protein